MALGVSSLSHFQYPFQLVAGRRQKAHFFCSILHHLSMLSCVLVGVLVRRPFLVWALSYFFWRMREELTEGKFRDSSSQEVCEMCLELHKVGVRQRMEPCNLEIGIPDVAPPLLWDLCLSEPPFSLCLNTVLKNSAWCPEVLKMRIKMRLKCLLNWKACRCEHSTCGFSSI